MTVRRQWTLAGVLALGMATLAFSTGAISAGEPKSQQGPPASFRDLWLTVEGKTGRLSFDQGHLVFFAAEQGATGPNVVEIVGPDYVVFAVGGSGARQRRVVHMTNVDLGYIR